MEDLLEKIKNIRHEKQAKRMTAYLSENDFEHEDRSEAIEILNKKIRSNCFTSCYEDIDELYSEDIVMPHPDIIFWFSFLASIWLVLYLNLL